MKGPTSYQMSVSSINDISGSSTWWGNGIIAYKPGIGGKWSSSFIGTQIGHLDDNIDESFSNGETCVLSCS